MECSICGLILTERGFKNHFKVHDLFNPTKEELYDLVINQKLSDVKIGKAFGVSPNPVSAMRKKYRIINLNEQKVYNISKEEILNYLDQGYSLSDIGRVKNCSHATVSNYCKIYNIQLDYKTKKGLVSVWLRKILTLDKFQELKFKTDLEIMQWYNSKAPEKVRIVSDESIRLLRKQYDLPSSIKIKQETMRSLTKDQLSDMYKDKTLAEIGKALNLGESTVAELKKKFSIKTKAWYTSVGQRNLANRIKELDISIVENCRKLIKPNEIDIVIKDYNVGIEYCGLYYHSNQCKVNNYHRSKMDACNKKGYRLITIFEDEWLYQNNICWSRILAALNKIDTKIYARKCEVREIPKDEAKIFLLNNHLQGPSKSKINFGLYYNNELQMILSLGSLSRAHVLKGKRALEIKRICTRNNTLVVGGLSKLFKQACSYAEGNNIEIIRSYCDLRWGTGESYKKLGFIKTHETKYTPQYVRQGVRYRNQTLCKTAEERKTGLTEAELRSQQGYTRIYDCGHQTWDYFLNQK